MSKSTYFIGVDVGGTNVKMVAVCPIDAAIRAKYDFATHDSPLAEWAEGVEAQIDQWETELGPAAGVGVASPGLVASDHRAVAWMQGRMEAVCGFDWTDYLRRPEPVPVINDAQAAMMGEAWIGAARGVRNALMLTLGTGVGGAAMVDGHVLQGALGRAGHLGHISLDPMGLLDIVRTPGSLEDAIGDASIYSRSKGKFSDTEKLVQAASAGDLEAQRIWRASIYALAAGIASLINVLDPEVILLGGGISRAQHLLLQPLRDRLDQIEWRPFGTGVPIVLAELGEYAGALGAARFAMQFIPPRLSEKP